MKVSIEIDLIAEQIAEDESGEGMALLLSSIIREFTGAPEGFGQWMQAAMNDARHQIPESTADWADDFILKVEQAAIKLY